MRGGGANSGRWCPAGLGKLLRCPGELLVVNDDASGTLVVHRPRDNLLDGTYANHLAESFALHGNTFAVPLHFRSTRNDRLRHAHAAARCRSVDRHFLDTHPPFFWTLVFKS